MTISLPQSDVFSSSHVNRSIVEFVKALQATIGKNLLITWDHPQGHRSNLVRAHAQAQLGQLMIYYLPTLAPDMNPVDCVSGFLKYRAMPNYCASDLRDVVPRACRNLHSIQRKMTLV